MKNVHVWLPRLLMSVFQVMLMVLTTFTPVKLFGLYSWRWWQKLHHETFVCTSIYFLLLFFLQVVKNKGSGKRNRLYLVRALKLTWPQNVRTGTHSWTSKLLHPKGIKNTWMIFTIHECWHIAWTCRALFPWSRHVHGESFKSCFNFSRFCGH